MHRRNLHINKAVDVRVRWKRGHPMAVFGVLTYEDDFKDDEEAAGFITSSPSGIHAVVVPLQNMSGALERLSIQIPYWSHL